MTKIKLSLITINGCGDSLWGPSKGQFEITEAEVRDLFGTAEPYELQLFGKSTEWHQYTDSQIEREVKAQLIPIIQPHYPDHIITSICWSEQGMQPDGGWSFDIIAELKVKDKS